MTRRSTPQRIIDDIAFPIRLRLQVPVNGYGERLDEYMAWLKLLGPDGAAWHSAALYMRDLDTAVRFLASFPELVMADRTKTRSRPGRV